LRDDRVHALGLCIDRAGDGANLQEHFHPGVVAALYERGGIAPEQRKDRNPFFHADLKALFRGAGQDQIDAKGPVGKFTNTANLLAQQLGRIGAGAKNAQASGPAHCRG
jgi:hypothetical protein